MNSIKVRKIPVSMLPKYRGVGGIGLDSAYIVQTDYGHEFGAIAKSGKEWVGYIRSQDESYKLLPWGAKTQKEATGLLMDDVAEKIGL